MTHTHKHTHRYGVGMAVGFAALVIMKKAVRSLPLVGSVAKPVLGESV